MPALPSGARLPARIRPPRARWPRAARWLAITACCSIGLAACADSGAPDTDADAGLSWTSVRSTAGDTTVMRSAGGLPEAGTHELTEQWRIGDVDGLDSTVTFGRIGGVAVREDNVLAVFDEALTTLRLYDADGGYVRTLGREGAGPGEYTRANGLAFLPDGRLALWDPPTSRISIYDVDTTTTEAWSPPVTGIYTNNALFSSSRYALAVRASLRDTTEDEGQLVRRRRTAYFMYDTTGAIVDTLVTPPPQVEEQVARAENEQISTAYGLPYAIGTMSQLLSDGRMATGTSGTYRIDIAGGPAPLRIAVQSPRVPVDPSDAREKRASVEWVMRNVQADWTWTLDDIPSVKPYFSDLFATEDGGVWVKIATPSERIPEAERAAPAAASPDGRPPRPAITWREATRYDVFDSNGALLGRVAMPPRSTLLAVRGDLAWGTIKDDLDVPYLVQWRIAPSWNATSTAP